MALRSVLISFLLVFGARLALAQADLEAERRSLRGVSSFSVEVTVEGPRHLTESDVLDGRTIRTRVAEILREAGLPVRAGEGYNPSLHIHLNMMSLDNGLVPFSADFTFRQRAQIDRNDYDMVAATWSESILGIVSYDLLSTILSSVEELAALFAEDYDSVNEGS